MTRTALRRPLRVLAVAMALTAGLPLVACGQTSDDSGSETLDPPDLAQSLTAYEWLLDVDDSSLTSGGSNPVTLVFANASSASGTGPCNTYRGAVTLDGEAGVRLEDIATTLMACEPDVMAAESEYLDALAQVRSADVSDTRRLVLTEGEVRLSYTALDPQTAIVGDWAIINVRTPGAVESVLLGTAPVARFGADQSLVVETGCNTLRTTWAVDGRALTIEQPAAGLKSCDEPAGVMEQEATITAALTATSTVQVTPALLTLLDEAGGIVLVARPA